MPQEYDLGQLLDAIREREDRLGRDGVGTALGMQMIQAARDFVRLPSLTSLTAFEKLEDEWRKLHPKARRRFATTFRIALGVELAPPPSYAGNTPYNKNWNPVRGFVYGFWSHDLHGLVKLGATTQHPQDRKDSFNRKYELQHLEIAFFFEVFSPAEVERHWTSYLRTYHCPIGRHGSREWYRLTPSEAVQHVLESIKSTKVKQLPLQYVLKNMPDWRDIDFWPAGPKQFGAHIVSRR